MRTVVHISDLHFDWVNPVAVPAAVRAIRDVRPDVVAVAGDLTQHAKRREFEHAMEFIEQLPGRHIIVPGNHDMAFLNPLRRVRQRLKLFREIACANPEPFYADEEIAVLGLNTARVTHLRHGRIRPWQVRHIEERMAGAGPDAIRILVTHHPFDLPAIYTPRDIVGRGGEFMARVVKCIDVLLAGHMHISHAGPTVERYQLSGDSAVFVQSGTALSTRVRGEANSFQVVRTAARAIEVTPYAFAGTAFEPGSARVFRREGQAWVAGVRDSIAGVSSQVL